MRESVDHGEVVLREPGGARARASARIEPFSAQPVPQLKREWKRVARGSEPGNERTLSGANNTRVDAARAISA
jgi:hypothetical protein